MPVWTPGSYLIREFERHVQDFEVADAAGQPLKWEKVNKNTWRVATQRRARVAREISRLRERALSANQRTKLRSRFLEQREPADVSRRVSQEPSTVRVVAPDVWKVATGLPGVPGQRNTFRAENFDVLYDSPFEASNFKTTRLQRERRCRIASSSTAKATTIPSACAATCRRSSRRRSS